MRLRLSLVVLGVSLAMTAQGWARVLPDACGSDAVKFKVTTEKGAAAPAGPSAEMAEVVFVQTPEMGSDCLGPSCTVTTRVGVDGAWVGAVRGKSYFSISVTPGEHHVCANWQSRIGNLNKLVGMASFTAEAGKVYYFGLKPEDKNRNLPLGPKEAPRPDWQLELAPLVEDEAKYAIKTSPLSKAEPQS